MKTFLFLVAASVTLLPSILQAGDGSDNPCFIRITGEESEQEIEERINQGIALAEAGECKPSIYRTEDAEATFRRAENGPLFFQPSHFDVKLRQRLYGRHKPLRKSKS